MVSWICNSVYPRQLVYIYTFIQNNFSELSDDDEEKPWYDVQPKTNERKSKLFASSFNALEDDEDSFSYE